MKTRAPSAEKPSQLFRRRLANARKLGFAHALQIGYDRCVLKILEKIYRFHPWHSQAPTSEKPYRYIVADIINHLEPTTVVEVGCGLGEILALTRAEHRYGYDLDAGVIRAARFLHGKNIRFDVGSFSEVKAKTVDVLVLINWIHEISPAELEENLAPLLPRTRYLLLDAIDPDGPAGYRFKHDFAFLGPNWKRLSSRRPENGGRSFILFEVCS